MWRTLTNTPPKARNSAWLAKRVEGILTLIINFTIIIVPLTSSLSQQHHFYVLWISINQAYSLESVERHHW